MSKTVYLISGANRGIGLGFTKALVKRDNVIVFAGARDLTRVAELEALAKEFPGKLYLIRLISADEASNKAAAEEIKAKVGRLDVVIANAGIARSRRTALETSHEDMQDHYEVNVIGPLALFQASYPLLKASTPVPKFVVISSRAGSITLGTSIPGVILSYGASKAAVNYLVRKLHFENDGLITLPICPGPVDTDMLAPAKDLDFFKDMNIPSVDEAVTKLLSIIDAATRSADGPVFHTIDGDTAPW